MTIHMFKIASRLENEKLPEIVIYLTLSKKLDSVLVLLLVVFVPSDRYLRDIIPKFESKHNKFKYI